jgi:hypothetical protein
MARRQITTAKLLRAGVLGKVAAAAAASTLALICSFASAAGQTPNAQYRHLPAQVRHYVEGVRKDCVDLNPQSKPDDLMQGIDSVKLGGAPALFVDAETLCNSRMAGANCNNRGCDLKIWKEVRPNSWQKVFDENLFRKFISVDDQGHFKLMVVTIYAGDLRCHPKPGKLYTSGKSCDALVHYRRDRWVWQKIQ